MKSIAIIALSVLGAASAMAQAPAQQSAQTTQMQCRNLIQGQNDFISSDETYVPASGAQGPMACKQVAAAPVVVASNVPAAPIPDKPAVAAIPENKVVAVEAKPVTAERDESEYMTPAEIQNAAQGNPHWVTITAGSDVGQTLLAAMADVNLVQEASIRLFTAQSWMAFSAQQQRRQYKQFTPASLSKAETIRGLTVVGFGMAYGSYAGPQCASVTRIALISDKSGEVVAEAVDQDPVPSTWSNAFGASATCQALVARFAEKDVERVSAAAQNGEYFIGVFSGNNGRFLYKVKRKFLKQLDE